MAKSKKNQNPVEDEMAEIYAEIAKGKVELNEENTMVEEKVKNEMVAVEDAPIMRVPQAVEVKPVPDEGLEVYNLIKQDSLSRRDFEKVIHLDIIPSSNSCAQYAFLALGYN